MKQEELVIEFEAEASDEEIIAMICDLAEYADSLHRAYGGHGLKVADVEIFDLRP